MQITRLVLNNFSSYEGINELDFSVEEGKPIVLIGGQNGAGKTSLFTAIKIALYGSLSFGYTGNNSYYFKKIKGLINNNAFRSQSFSSGVSIGIMLVKDRELTSYTIERNWMIEDSKIVEEYNIYEGGRRLNESEKSFIESYILSVIPIDLFDFFLFDGEEIGNIFSAEGYNKYLKKAVLTVCGIDDLEILNNFSNNYIGKINDNAVEKLKEDHTLLQLKLLELEKDFSDALDTVAADNEEISNLNVLIEQKKSEFNRSGGLSDAEKKNLEEKILKLEKKRLKINHDIRSFFEDYIPFFIMKDLIAPMKKQSRYEEKATIYDYVRNMLSKEYIADALKKYSPDSSDIASDLYDTIIKKFEVTSGVFDEIVFGFSEFEQGKVFTLADYVKDFDYQNFVDSIHQKNAVIQELTSIKQKLRSALSEEDAKKYTDVILKAEHKIEILTLEINRTEENIEQLKSEKESLKNEILSLKEKICVQTKDKHIIELTNNISNILTQIISASMENIRNNLSSNIRNNLMQIYRKDNLVSDIKISEDFKFELYQTQEFSIADLKSLLANVGKKEFYKILGDKSIKSLCSFFSVSGIDHLEKSILSSNKDGCLLLYKKIDLNMLSKGERQIFILALYWAIIQVSEVKIPFIIDTPYARIDANHRAEISSKFFPGISDQVVILSTDEEITREYYSIIRKYISKEYLLNNNQGDNRTTVSGGYFFKDDDL